MDSKTKNNYAFIDSQNLNLGVKSQAWNLDFAKFRQLLRDKYKIEKAYLLGLFQAIKCSMLNYKKPATFVFLSRL